MIVVLLTAYRRTRWWDQVARGVCSIARSDFCKVPVRFLLTNRGPATTVAHDALAAELDKDKTPLEHLALVTAPFNPLEPGQPERFIELRKWQVEQAARLWPGMTHFIINDDDQYPSPKLRDTVVILTKPEEQRYRPVPINMVTASKVYFGSADRKTILGNFPEHTSGYMFRYFQGDTWSRTAPSPVRCHTEGFVSYGGELWDFGYVDQDDRQRAWDEYRKVGKIDPVTIQLAREPVYLPAGPYQEEYHDAE